MDPSNAGVRASASGKSGGESIPSSTPATIVDAVVRAWELRDLVVVVIDQIVSRTRCSDPFDGSNVLRITRIRHVVCCLSCIP